MSVLITGTAGFIGFTLARRLLDRGGDVVGIYNLNPYYDPSLKAARLALLEAYPRYRHAKLDLEDRDRVAALFAETKPAQVVNLAARPACATAWKSPRLMWTPTSSAS